MAKRDLLSVTDFTAEEVHHLLSRATDLKNSNDKPLSGRSIALMFEKPSLRTRSSFEVGIHQLGGHCVYLGPTEIAIGKREPVSHIAQVANGYYDAIVARVFEHETLAEFAGHTDIPIINALSNWEHPCQLLSDVLTVSEHSDDLHGLKIVYVGDGDNNVARSMALVMPPLGVSVVIASPEGYELDQSSIDLGNRRAHHGATVSLQTDPQQAVKDADFVYTDVWASMGQEDEIKIRQKAFQAYKVTPELMSKAKTNARFMHDLPAHLGDEVSEDMLEHPSTIVFHQAHNRLHLQKAILEFLLTKSA